MQPSQVATARAVPFIVWRLWNYFANNDWKLESRGIRCQGNQRSCRILQWDGVAHFLDLIVSWCVNTDRYANYRSPVWQNSNCCFWMIKPCMVSDTHGIPFLIWAYLNFKLINRCLPLRYKQVWTGWGTLRLVGQCPVKWGSLHWSVSN